MRAGMFVQPIARAASSLRCPQIVSKRPEGDGPRIPMGCSNPLTAMSSARSPRAPGSISSRSGALGSSIASRLGLLSCQRIIVVDDERAERRAAWFRLLDDEALSASDPPRAVYPRGDGEAERVTILDDGGNKHSPASLYGLAGLG